MYKGSIYVVANIGADGEPLDGAKTYRVHVPPKVAMKSFWAFTVHDNQTQAMLQTDQQFPGIHSNQKDFMQNADRSCGIWRHPKAPGGKAVNWLQTIPGKGWNMLRRIYGPTQAWHDKT
jgi:hypothetical protein